MILYRKYGTIEGVKKPIYTVIIPIEKKSAYVMEALKLWDSQTYKSFEVLISSTKRFSIPYSFARVIVDPSLKGNIAAKRNKILKHGAGSIFIFHDDDVFVPPTYLHEVDKIFKNRTIIAAGGP